MTRSDEQYDAFVDAAEEVLRVASRSWSAGTLAALEGAVEEVNRTFELLAAADTPDEPSA